MNKEEQISNIEKEITRLQYILGVVKTLEQGKIYEVHTGWAGVILGQLTGFTFGMMSLGVRFTILGSRTEFHNKSVTINFGYGDKEHFIPVKDIDLPRYLSWHLTEAFEKKIRRIKI